MTPIATTDFRIVEVEGPVDHVCKRLERGFHIEFRFAIEIHGQIRRTKQRQSGDGTHRETKSQIGIHRWTVLDSDSGRICLATSLPNRVSDGSSLTRW